MRKWILFALAFAVCPFAAQADEAAAPKPAVVATNDFAVCCSNAWLKGVTDKCPVGYALNEDIAFSITLEGVTNAIPAGAYRYRWKRTGDDGVTEEGFAPVEKKPFVCTTRSAKPGTVRLSVEMVGKDDKPFLKKNGTATSPLRFVAGAVVAPEQILPHDEPKDFAKGHKDLVKRLGKPAFKKVPRTPAEQAAPQGYAFGRVELPSPTAHPLKGLLVVPPLAAAGTRLPCRLAFAACGYDAEVSPPKPNELRPNEVVFTIAYDPGKPETRDEAFCTALCLEALRALQYLKSLPEWDGKALLTGGWGMDGLLAIWVAASGEGITGLSFGNVPLAGEGLFDPQCLARHIPASCRTTVWQAGIGDPVFPATPLVALWNAMSCERSLVWVQGAEGWSKPKAYKDRDHLWERLTPVRFVRMDAEHAKVEEGLEAPYADVGTAFTDKIVIEVLFDYTKDSLDFQQLSQLSGYAKEGLAPVEAYLVVPEKKIKDKVWNQFRERLKKGSVSVPFPVYFNAGIDMPSSDLLPWYHLVGPDGVLRYSGNDFGAMSAAYRGLLAKLPPADPVFAYARPVLFKDLTDKLVKDGLPGGKIHRTLETEMKRAQRKDPARAAEARHLLVGMRQAVDRRLGQISKLYQTRPGLAICDLQDLLAEWPDAAALPKAVGLTRSIGYHPDYEKLAKLERELRRLQAWKPEKPSEVKKREAAVEAFRKKLDRLSKSKDVMSEGEALLMMSELDANAGG